ncbi:hypothetical protein ACLB2K_028826 [Fragaria x ananassa]
MAGSGPWEQRYNDLGPRVLVLESMSPSKLQAFYNAIDVFVNSTLRPQGLDLTLMEVMMSGKPVVASRFRSIKGSIVVDDEFGFMFAPNVASLLEALELAVKEGSRSLNNFSRKSSFPVGHPSWDCSSINMLNLGVPIPSEAAEPPKGLALDWRWACTYTAHNPSPFGRCGILQSTPLRSLTPSSAHSHHTAEWL